MQVSMQVNELYSSKVTLASFLHLTWTLEFSYWRPTLAIDCFLLDAGQTDIMIDRNDKPIAAFTYAEPRP